MHRAYLPSLPHAAGPTMLHADLERRALQSSSNLQWIASPAPGVDRYMLDRIGGEVARATTVVRFSPGAKFPAHTHGGGEEYLVLKGAFHDHDGAHRVGTYVRNPIGTWHAPWTEADGCIALVKLHQMHESDTQQMQLDTQQLLDRAASMDGVTRAELYCNVTTGEVVAVERWEAGTQVDSVHSDASYTGGEELFVIEGVVAFEGTNYPQWSFLRFPPIDSSFMPSLPSASLTKDGMTLTAASLSANGATHPPTSLSEIGLISHSALSQIGTEPLSRIFTSHAGCTVFRKTGHLRHEIHRRAAAGTAAAAMPKSAE